ncbi:MAG: hypothetical protein H8E21_17210, partial [Gammaproteobacteria bacterium]|nr:hypothetical protein [Gammaproteobacteria bacterium]
MNEAINEFSNSETLIIDTDSGRANILKTLLSFIKYSTQIITPEQLANMDKSQLDACLAIFTINDEQVRSYFLDLNQATKSQYPLVLLAPQQDLDNQNIVAHLPYISALCFEADYYSLSNILDS